MAIKINQPMFLILLPILLFGIFYSLKYRKTRAGKKSRFITVCRSTVIVLLILSLSGVNLTLTSNHNATLFLLDSSDSMAVHKSKAEEFTEKAMGLKPQKDEAGVIAFGKTALTEVFLSKDAAFKGVNTAIDGRYTNLQEALSSAQEGFSTNSGKRMVIITDGQDNLGDIDEILPFLKDIDLKLFKLNSENKTEVALNSVTVPQKTTPGQEYTVTVNVESTVSTKAKLAVFDGEARIAYEDVELTPGENRFVFKDRAEEKGFRTYRAVIEPDLDQVSVNNEAAAFTDTIDRPKVLLAEGTPGEGDELEKILQALAMDFERVSAENMPIAIEKIATYQSIILCNISAENIPYGFMDSIESYVEDLGGGLITIGGDNAYALGGYFKTPLEDVLPVKMEISGKEQAPDMSIVLVIDKSGSMTDGNGGITKLDLAKEAAVRSLESLRSNDKIGVMAFDDTVYWPVEIQKADAKDKITNDIGTIRSGGGTSIIPALDEAYIKLSKSDTKIKHIILLTDGQGEDTGYERIVEDANKNGITISTVAVGRDAAKGLLANIAEKANGRFYETNNISAIPSIFAKETFMANGTYLNNRTFTPVITSSHSILSGLEEGLPNLYGYVGTSSKDLAKTVLTSDKGEPILSLWQKGLGRSVAWTSDMSGLWSHDYMGWDKTVKLWQNILTYAGKAEDSGNLTLEVQGDGGKMNLVMTTDEGTRSSAKAIMVSPSNVSKEITLYPTAPGKFEGSVESEEKGVYLLSGIESVGDEVKNTTMMGFAVNYSPEYKIADKTNTIEKLIAAGATLITDPNEVYKGVPPHSQDNRDLTTLLLMLALFIFIVDIVARRLNISINVLKKPKEKESQKPKPELKKEKSEDSKKEPEKKPQIKSKAEKPKAKVLDTERLLKRK